MAEVRTGLRHVLAVPFIYDAFQHMVGAYAWRRRAVKSIVSPVLNEQGSVLDIGCGTADVLSYLPNGIRYTGFDRNASYIEQARHRYAARPAEFFCAEFSGTLPDETVRFDVVLALGLLHHLDDDDGKGLFASARNVLKPDGIFLTLDPLLTPQQSAAARYFVTRDRGKNVRTLDHYLQLARASFDAVDALVDRDPLRIPYTGIVLRCSGNGASSDIK